ncbi:MAG: polysaccharide biosynthesis protein, partial [Candidatus Cryptobacteroides sp.]
MTDLIRKFLNRYFSSWVILLIDTCVSTFATCFVLLLLRRFLGLVDIPALSILLIIFSSALLSAVAFVLMHSYRGVIRHATLRVLWRLGIAVVLKGVLLGFFGFLCLNNGTCDSSMMYRAFVALLFDVAFTLVLLIVVRLIMIGAYDYIKKSLGHKHLLNVLIYGCGEKSVSLVTRLRSSSHYKVVGFIAPGSQMKNHTISEQPVYNYNNEGDFRKVVEHSGVEAILFPTSALAREEQEHLIRYAIACNIKILLSPQIDEVIDGKIMNSSVREIKIEDLLGRNEIKISMEEIIAGFKGRTIMVTGAAGSIGSELCRQLAGFGVSHLVLYDNAETPMHNLRLELEERFPDLKFTPVIGDVRMPARLDFVFRKFHPSVVFHAAAYKHVPLMEENPCEAVLVNVAGSRNVADKCIEYGVEKMVMISTDKAVN